MPVGKVTPEWCNLQWLLLLLFAGRREKCGHDHLQSGRCSLLVFSNLGLASLKEKVMAAFLRSERNYTRPLLRDLNSTFVTSTKPSLVSPFSAEMYIELVAAFVDAYPHFLELFPPTEMRESKPTWARLISLVGCNCSTKSYFQCSNHKTDEDFLSSQFLFSPSILMAYHSSVVSSFPQTRPEYEIFIGHPLVQPD